MKRELPAAGWFCSYTPLELMDAAGFRPVRISGGHLPTSIADSLMHTNICPYIKSCLEAAESGKYDYLKCAVFTNGCDAQRRFYDVWKTMKKEIPAFLLNVPKKTRLENVCQFSSRMEEMKEWFEELTGAEIGEDVLAGSIKKYRRLRESMKNLDAMRRTDKLLSGSEVLEIMLKCQSMNPGEAEACIIDEIRNARRDQGSKGPAVLLAGNMLDDPEWFKIIESYGARVVADDLCTGRRFWDLQPAGRETTGIESLAESYLKKSPCPRMSEYPDSVDYLKRLIEEIRPDGIIFYTMKFCDTHLYNMPQLRMMLKQIGIKSLFMESDYTSGSGQAATRIQAFVEML